MEKTNVMRLLEQKKIPYLAHEYDPDTTDGQLVARALGQEPAGVFKTLVTESPDRSHWVFVIPVDRSLNLKKAARAAGVKALSMLKQKELLPLTGYVHGGCSPLGMKKAFPTFFEESFDQQATVCVSAGRRGKQVELAPGALLELCRGRLADLCDPQPLPPPEAE